MSDERSDPFLHKLINDPKVCMGAIGLYVMMKGNTQEMWLEKFLYKYPVKTINKTQLIDWLGEIVRCKERFIPPPKEVKCKIGERRFRELSPKIDNKPPKPRKARLTIYGWAKTANNHKYRSMARI
jgi:hypothetical protein